MSESCIDPESPESWGRLGKNVYVAEEVDVRAFWDLFQQVSSLAPSRHAAEVNVIAVRRLGRPGFAPQPRAQVECLSHQHIATS